MTRSPPLPKMADGEESELEEGCRFGPHGTRYRGSSPHSPQVELSGEEAFLSGAQLGTSTTAVVILSSFVFIGCDRAVPSPDVSAVQTQAAKDVIATITALAPTATATPTNTPLPTATDTPTSFPTNTPAPIGSPTPLPYGSRTNPVPFGSAYVAGGWEITVVAFDDDAWPEIFNENPFGAPPAEGKRMVMVRVRVTNVMAERAWTATEDFCLSGSSGAVYNTFLGDYYGYSGARSTPDELGEQLLPGESTEGNVSFEIPIAETGLRLLYRRGISVSTWCALDASTFFAVA